MKSKIDNQTRSLAIGFLVWFRSQYKSGTSETYAKMAAKYGQYNYGTCRNLLKELVQAGYIRVYDNGLQKRKFIVNPKKYNELVNPFILNKEESK